MHGGNILNGSCRVIGWHAGLHAFAIKARFFKWLKCAWLTHDVA